MLGEKILRIVENSGMSKGEIARKVGITQSYLSQIFLKTTITTDLLEKIATVVDVPVADFFTDSDNSSKPRENAVTASIQGELIDALKDQVATYKLLVHELPAIKQRIEALERAIKTNKSV